jgi:RNA polymerase sigma factor (TIGR02999 family)
MRMILVDQARSRTRQRRGSGRRPLDLENVEIPVEERAAEIVALDEALLKLGEVDGELAQIVEWRFFAGLSVEEIAEMSGRSERTIKRHWQAARAFLFQELSAEEAGS